MQFNNPRQAGANPIRLNLPAAAWIAFMAVAAAGLSLGFACAAPLAAIGALAALTLSKRAAVVAVGTAWLANQAIGCTVLNYPLTANSLEWGAALGGCAVLAMFAARWAGRRFAAPAVAGMAAFAVAFGTYQLAHFGVAYFLLGGTEDYSVAIIARASEIEAVSMLAMLLVNSAAARVAGGKRAAAHAASQFAAR